MKILLAFDSFKGCMTSLQAGEAARRGVLSAMPDAETEVLAVADGGEGMSAAVYANGTGEVVAADAVDPLSRPIRAEYTYDCLTQSAYIDFAAASGLTLLADAEKSAVKSTSFGTGMLMADAIRRGARHIFLGLGGSATNDAGLGALQALGAKFTDESGCEITHAYCGADMVRTCGIDTTALTSALHGIRLTLLCDVDNPFCGQRGAVAVFARQKWADADEMRMLEEGMNHVGEVMKKCGFTDVFQLQGAGAGGGAGGGFAALAGGEIVPGAESVLKLCGFDEKLTCCDLVMTGEGKSDRQTLAGKLPYTVMTTARRHGVPTALFCGAAEDADALEKAGFAAVTDINGSMKSGDFMSVEVASQRLAAAVADSLTGGAVLRGRK